MASLQLAKFAILAVLLISATAPTFGEMGYYNMNPGVRTMGYYNRNPGVRTKVVAVIGDEQAEPEMMGINRKLSCVDPGWYCNTIFGPSCCTGTCLAVPPVGGVCIAA